MKYVREYILIIVLLCVLLFLMKRVLYTRSHVSMKIYPTRYNDKNRSIRIIENAFSDEMFHKIRNYLDIHTDIRSYPSESGMNQIAERSSMVLDGELFHFVYKTLESNTFGLRNARVSRVIPIEYRIYKSGSFGMKWHSDIRVLPKNKTYYEVIFVIYNNSDNMFEYVENNTPEPVSNKSVPVTSTNLISTRKVFTAPNTVVLIHPETIVHRSTPLHYGEKIFLKYVLEYD